MAFSLKKSIEQNQWNAVVKFDKRPIKVPMKINKLKMVTKLNKLLFGSLQKNIERPSSLGSRRLVESRVTCNGLHLCGHQHFAKDEGRVVLGRRLALLAPVDSVRLRTASTYWNVLEWSAPSGSRK